MTDPDTRLATYGTLSPGRSNHDQLAGLRGTWTRGSVRGRLIEGGWGATLGYPALTLDTAGPTIECHVFESADLPAHWARLDEFEGDGYRRVIATVQTDAGEVRAWIYVSADDLPP